MTTNPSAHTVLCYGDSNTWGQKPDKSGRYPVDIRWTGRLQRQLGDNYEIVEEGLSSRTTDLEYPKKPGRNGKTYLISCLPSHNPLDLVVLMLGTNDLKIEFDRSPEDIASAIEGLVDDVHAYAKDKAGHVPQILLVSPIHVDATAPTFDKLYGGVHYDDASASKSRLLAKAIEAVADKTGCAFFDASTVSQAGEDGIHFSEEAHTALANALEQKVRELV